MSVLRVQCIVCYGAVQSITVSSCSIAIVITKSNSTEIELLFWKFSRDSFIKFRFVFLFSISVHFSHLRFVHICLLINVLMQFFSKAYK